MSITRVIICKECYLPETWEAFDVEQGEIQQFIFDQFDGTRPSTMRIYNGQVAVENDITPLSEVECERLETAEGPLWVVVYPNDPITIIIIAVVAVVAVVAATFLLMPKSPQITNRSNNSVGSSNNALADRQNAQRLNSRIPDIFGTVYSVPDLIQVPYRKFLNNIEYEVCYMCIGKGQFTYDITKIYEDETTVQTIFGESIAIYGPNTSPNAGAPVLTIGDPINETVRNVKRVNGVNGQTLFPPNYKYLDGTEPSVLSFRNVSDDKPNFRIHSSNTDMTSGGVNLQSYFESGDTIVIPHTSYTVSGHSGVDLFGTYPVSSIAGVTESAVYLDNPQLINSAWNLINSGDTTPDDNPILSANPTSPNNWVGPYIIGSPDIGSLIFNFIAPQGLYQQDNDGNEAALNITVQIGVTPIADDGVTATGPEVFYNAHLVGSCLDKTQRAATLTHSTTTTNFIAVRAMRVSPDKLTFPGTTVMETQWRDLYVCSRNLPHDFGNVSTIQTLTRATPTALAVAERKLNLIVQRKVPIYNTGTMTFGALAGTNSADDIIAFVAQDQYIGNRSLTELDLDSPSGIYATVAAIKTYFGVDACGEFCYTFDDNNISFEETMATIALAIFSTAYRQGSVISIFFEKQTSNSVLYFGHRAKIPLSEKRTTTFGLIDNFDCVRLDYPDPNNFDQITSVYVPADQSGINPKIVQSVGIRDDLQAYFAANRYFNKIQNQYLNTTFDGLAQAELLVISNRIAVTDNTRPDVQDGEVRAQSGLQLTLSKAVTFLGGHTYSIFLQHYDKTVESIPCTAGTNPNQVVLGHAPALALVIGDQYYSPCKYELVYDTQAGVRAFLVTETTPNDDGTGTINVSAINYSDLYYANDLDYSLGYVDEGGNITEKGIKAHPGNATGIVGRSVGTVSFMDRFIFF